MKTACFCIFTSGELKRLTGLSVVKTTLVNRDEDWLLRVKNEKWKLDITQGGLFWEPASRLVAKTHLSITKGRELQRVLCFPSFLRPQKCFTHTTYINPWKTACDVLTKTKNKRKKKQIIKKNKKWRIKCISQNPSIQETMSAWKLGG